jgi:hypothetical protein
MIRANRPALSRTRRWLGVAAACAVAAAVGAVSASAVAASHAAPSNYRSPDQIEHAATAGQGTSDRAAGDGASTASAGKKKPPVTHHYSLAASAFAPDGLHTTTDDYFNSWDPSTLSNTDTGRCFNAGLSLPVGITLKSLTVYYTAGSTAMFVELNRQDLPAHTFTNLVDFDTTIVTTPAYTSVTKTIPAGDASVNMTKYAYSFGVCPSGTTTFSGLTITYTQPAS